MLQFADNADSFHQGEAPSGAEAIQNSTKGLTSFEELVEWVSHQREGILHAHLLYDVHLVAFSPFAMTLRLSKKAPKDLPQRLQSLLKKKRNEAWMIAISDEIGHPTLYEKEQKVHEERREFILQDPLVKKLVEAFPGATLVEIEET